MRKNFLTGIITGIAAISVCAVVALASAGGEDDPLISKSYLDKIFMPEIQQQTSFKVVELTAGQRLIGGEGCELILRQGTATIIATAKGGIADTSGGTDLWNGLKAPANHHLIIPVADGRGLAAENTVLVMVKGMYEIR